MAARGSEGANSYPSSPVSSANILQPQNFTGHYSAWRKPNRWDITYVGTLRSTYLTCSITLEVPTLLVPSCMTRVTTYVGVTDICSPSFQVFIARAIHRYHSTSVGRKLCRLVPWVAASQILGTVAAFPCFASRPFAADISMTIETNAREASKMQLTLLEHEWVRYSQVYWQCAIICDPNLLDAPCSFAAVTEQRQIWR